jgi:fibronectin-binding autotransporter adhesin
MVSGGVLVVNGSSLSATTVQGGGSLGGSGTLNALATIESGGVLAPGNSPGTMTFTSGLTINDGAAFNFELGSTSDIILVTGGTLTGPASVAGATFNFAAASGFGAGTYTLIDGTGAALTGFKLTDFTLGTGIGGYNFSFGLTGNVLSVTATAVPEPATSAIIFGASVLGLAGFARRRRIAR